MLDTQIVELFWCRNEQAIAQAKQKYSQYCYSIAYNILRNSQDAEECVNDTYLAAWNTIPPQRPDNLAEYLGKICRNLSLKRLRDDSVIKRGGAANTVSLDEFATCIPAGKDFREELQAWELTQLLNEFLRSLSAQDRRVFVCRYWYCDSVEEICIQFGFGKSKVKMILLRTRNKLQEFLIKEGVFCEE